MVKVEVLFLSGQSNSLGHTQISLFPYWYIPNAYAFENGIWNDVYPYIIFGPQDRRGIEVYLLNDIAALCGACYLVKYGRGGTSSQEWTTGGVHYNIFVNKAKDALDNLRVQGIDFNITWIHIQGERDATTCDPNYKQNVINMHTDAMQTWGINVDKVAFFLGMLNPLVPLTGYSCRDKVRSMQRQIVSEITNAELIDTTGIPLDWDNFLHYGPIGEKIYAERVFEKFKKRKQGVFCNC